MMYHKQLLLRCAQADKQDIGPDCIDGLHNLRLVLEIAVSRSHDLQTRIFCL